MTRATIGHAASKALIGLVTVLAVLMLCAGCKPAGNGRGNLECTAAQRQKALAEAEQEIYIEGTSYTLRRSEIIDDALSRNCKGAQ